MSEYRCIRKCFHNGRLFKPGDRFTPKPEEKVPHHFAPSEKYVERMDPTPRLGTKTTNGQILKQNPSVKAPGKDKDTAKPKSREE